MCGIVGIISKQTSGFRHKDTDLFKQMLYADALRGFDSTGIFGVNKYGNLKMIKAAKDAGAATLNYGTFITVVINFLLMALVIFMLVRFLNRVSDRLSPKKEEAPKPVKICPYCKSEISPEVTRCPHCTSQL